MDAVAPLSHLVTGRCSFKTGWAIVQAAAINVGLSAESEKIVYHDWRKIHYDYVMPPFTVANRSSFTALSHPPVDDQHRVNNIWKSFNLTHPDQHVLLEFTIRGRHSPLGRRTGSREIHGRTYAVIDTAESIAEQGRGVLTVYADIPVSAQDRAPTTYARAASGASVDIPENYMAVYLGPATPVSESELVSLLPFLEESGLVDEDYSIHHGLCFHEDVARMREYGQVPPFLFNYDGSLRRRERLQRVERPDNGGAEIVRPPSRARRRIRLRR